MVRLQHAEECACVECPGYISVPPNTFGGMVCLCTCHDSQRGKWEKIPTMADYPIDPCNDPECIEAKEQLKALKDEMARFHAAITEILDK